MFIASARRLYDDPIAIQSYKYNDWQALTRESVEIAVRSSLPHKELLTQYLHTSGEDEDVSAVPKSPAVSSPSSSDSSDDDDEDVEGGGNEEEEEAEAEETEPAIPKEVTLGADEQPTTGGLSSSTLQQQPFPSYGVPLQQAPGVVQQPQQQPLQPLQQAIQQEAPQFQQPPNVQQPPPGLSQQAVVQAPKPTDIW